MELPLNKNKPLIMHIDLNSCFATVCQQAFIHLRGKPLVIAAYATPSGCIVSPSIEAKRYGIKVGMTVREAKLIYKDVLVRTPDPPLVRDVHVKFKKIFEDYSPLVIPKSIDEAIIDFHCMEHILKRNLIEIGKEIKQRLRREIGEWISCSIGIGTNRFLAKTAASLRKPDGLEVINYQRIRDVYEKLKLIDLCGINKRYEVRLNAAGIFSPSQFLDSPLYVLQKQVFQSINGYYWYLRLRGYEIDTIEFARKSYGQDFALGKATSNPQELAKILMKLCEKMGRRLRRTGHSAKGIHIACLYTDSTFWHRGKKMSKDMYATFELYKNALWLLNQQPEKKTVTKISVSCYDLIKSASSSQMNLFDLVPDKTRKISDALDEINNRYGEFTIIPALMMGMDQLVLDRIAFGGVKDLEDLYSNQKIS